MQAYSCDAITGAVIDRVKVDSFSWARLLSAGDAESKAVVPLDGTFTKTQLRTLFAPWERMLVLERDGAVEYMGYITGRGYTRGGGLSLRLEDLWSLLARRGAWDHSAPNVEKWKTTVTGSLAQQAAQAIVRGRDTGPPLPAMGMPLTLPGQTGPSVTRTYYGYHLEMVGDVLSDLLDEGLDIYFKPRWISIGDADWLFHAGPAWGSGVVHEIYATAPESALVGFSEDADASRVTNNARFVGEGSEEDMLVRSQRDVSSSLPLLDRSTQAKNIANASQLSALASQQLAAFRHPTFQWELELPAGQVDVGDTVRLFFDGDPWIADGMHERRVVGIKGDMTDMVTVTLQSTGGA